MRRILGAMAMAAVTVTAFALTPAPALAQKGGQSGVETAPPIAAPAPVPVGAGPLAEALNMVGAALPAGEAAAFAEVMATLPAGVGGDTLGHLLYARRHWDKSAWFFGAEAVADPSDAASLNNFAAMLVQVNAAGALPDAVLPLALDAARMAAALDPGSAAIQNNLGNVARRLGHADEAVAAARRATELAPDEPLYWANLARALEAAGDSAGAAQALARARSLEPNGLAYLAARGTLPAGPPYAEALARTCTVDFRCQATCPKSIIGQINLVTCEIANSSAQMACAAGEPYATSFSCAEELPEYGILIPGLNAGFSVAGPGFSFHAVVDGEGNVDVRVEAGVNVGPVGGYVRADGHFTPDGGASFDNFGGGARLSLGGSSAAANTASALGHPPAHIEVETVGGQPAQLNLETYNAGLISY